MPVAPLLKKLFSFRFWPHNIQLILVWLLGFVTGYVLGFDISATMILGVAGSGFLHVSFWCLLFSTLTPFLAVYGALVLGANSSLLLILFAKGLFFAFSICCVGVAFGNAAWVARWLCFFSNCLCTVLFLWYVFSFLDFSKPKRRNGLIACLTASFFITYFDYIFVSPVIVKILE